MSVSRILTLPEDALFNIASYLNLSESTGFATISKRTSDAFLGNLASRIQSPVLKSKCATLRSIFAGGNDSQRGIFFASPLKSLSALGKALKANKKGLLYPLLVSEQTPTHRIEHFFVEAVKKNDIHFVQSILNGRASAIWARVGKKFLTMKDISNEMYVVLRRSPKFDLLLRSHFGENINHLLNNNFSIPSDWMGEALCVSAAKNNRNNVLSLLDSGKVFPDWKIDALEHSAQYQGRFATDLIDSVKKDFSAASGTKTIKLSDSDIFTLPRARKMFDDVVCRCFRNAVANNDLAFTTNILRASRESISPEHMTYALGLAEEKGYAAMRHLIFQNK